ncbi:hypothetical protein AAFF_G00098590 [Aldrovandia affinis]|uniref:B box-type domain-containing protein n=1 Tax=Aldrovandia affinis TaxID=143900 RepID=A0AAD7RV67_9TELE|nr:hypothetical protein AAFF_G00098590 [Aldrovandia affinis]
MNCAGGAVGQGREEDLPQSDGTCDACEPDEAQPATQMCRTCDFAFCAVHGDKHQRSTSHVLQPYSQLKEPAPGQGGGREEGAVGGGDGVAEAGETKAEGEGAGLALPLGGGRSRETVTVERLRCKVHGGQEGSLYCKNDEKIICVVCAVQGEHSRHEIITLREAYMWQKSKGGIDLLGSTQTMAKRITSKWTCPDTSTDQLESYVNVQFDELHRLVRLEEKRTLHLVDLKEAFLTAQAAEKIAEITLHTERLQEEMDSITQQLGALDQEEQEELELGAAPAPALPDIEARPRPDPRQDRPRDHGEGGSGSFMGHAP